MRLNIVGDLDWESKIEKTLNELSDFGFRQHFERSNHGKGLEGLTVVFMCQDPALNLKRRIKYSKKESKIYMDIMLNLPAMKAATPEERKREVAQRLFDEVPDVLANYKIPDFDKEAFISDFSGWIDSVGWR